MIAPGLNYIGMKGQNVYKDNERNNIISKKPTFVYPAGGRTGDVHIFITQSVADRMTTKVLIYTTSNALGYFLFLIEPKMLYLALNPPSPQLYLLTSVVLFALPQLTPFTHSIVQVGQMHT